MRAAKPLPLRVEERLRELVDKMVEIHGAHTITDYIGGLVVIDAFRSGKAEWLRNVAIPSWATGVILAISKGTDIQLPAVTSEGVQRGSKNQRS